MIKFTPIGAPRTNRNAEGGPKTEKTPLLLNLPLSHGQSFSLGPSSQLSVVI